MAWNCLNTKEQTLELKAKLHENCKQQNWKILKMKLVECQYIDELFML